jgi:E3 ubiquitin-protein ligase RNF216
MKGRITVEEAISAVKIRRCPKCNKAFIKSDGCNKMTCGCGINVCYLCRAQIQGYSHFCQVPHCTHAQCKGCPLHTKAEEDDLRAMREAGIKAASETPGVHVDVDSLLKEPLNQAIK